ncbi:MAG: cytochrome c [Bacteroidota bacterium]
MKKYLPVLFVLLMISMVSLAFVGQPVEPINAGVTPVATASTDGIFNDEGEQIYMTRCMSCHMAGGEGVTGVFPPLAESEYVSGDKGRLIRMIMHGLTGEIVVNDVTYSGMMPPWGGFLNDKQIADVLTYVRANFDNDADAVTEDEVARVRASVGERDVWTIEELNKEENLGIPEGD